ncbi:MAG: YabP/YqfC family sporulation protein [Butyricicoccaceae bacterium]
MSSAPHVEIDGNHEVVIGQHRAIVLYSAEEMQIDCGRLLIRILGSGLELKVLTAEELSICGTVAAVEYLTH